jgi:hypothetical protein
MLKQALIWTFVALGAGAAQAQQVQEWSKYSSNGFDPVQLHDPIG